MEKIVFLLETEFYACLSCAYLAEFLDVDPKRSYEIITIFVAEIKSIDSKALFNECDIIVAIGSESEFQKERAINNFKAKLLILDPFGDEEGDKDANRKNKSNRTNEEICGNDFVAILPIGERSEKLNRLINVIFEIANTLGDGNNYLNFQKDLKILTHTYFSEDYFDDSLGDEEDDEENIEDFPNEEEFAEEPVPDENIQIGYGETTRENDILIFLLEDRYCQISEIIERFHLPNDKLEFHKSFILEIINQKIDQKIETLMQEYNDVVDRTLNLEKEILPLIPNNFEIGYVYSDDQAFFDDDILDSGEKLGYFAMVIEFTNNEGESVTVFRENFKEKQIFPGGLNINMHKIIKK